MEVGFFKKTLVIEEWNRSGILECVNLDDMSGCLHIDNAVSHLKSTVLEILGCSDVEKIAASDREDIWNHP